MEFPVRLESNRRITRRMRSTRSTHSLSSTPPVRRRSLRHILQPLPSPSSPQEEEESSKIFDPSDPYSAAMDNIPLKDLFPNMKIRKRSSSQNMKIETVCESSASPKGSVETDESARFKFRDSLASALTMVDCSDMDQDGVDVKRENQMDSEGIVKEHNQMSVETFMKRESQADSDVLRNEAILMNGDAIMAKEKEINDKHTRKGENQVNMEDLTEIKNQINPQALTESKNEMKRADILLMPLQMQEEVKESLELAPNLIVRKAECRHSEEEYSFSIDENPESLEMDERPFKRSKLEAGNVEREDEKDQPQDLAERVAVNIESELHRYIGGVNNKYKEKAQSVLFNLKDHCDPDLRARVLSGRISCQNPCSMNPELLTSKELSMWKIAKAEEFAHMVVLTDSDVAQAKLFEKTHKGESELTIEKDDLWINEIVAGSSKHRVRLPTKQEADQAQEVQQDREAERNQEADEAQAAKEAQQCLEAEEAQTAQVAQQSREAEEAQADQEAQHDQEVEEAQAVQEAQQCQEAEEAHAAQAAQAAQQSQGAEETQADQESQKMQEAEEPQHNQEAEEAQAVQEAQQCQEAEEAQAAQAVQQSQGAEEAQADQESQQMQEAEEAQADQESQQMQEAEEAQHDQEAEEAQAVQEAQQCQEAEEAQAAQQNQEPEEAQADQETQEMQEAEEAQTAEAVQETEAAQGAQQSQEPEEAQASEATAETHEAQTAEAAQDTQVAQEGAHSQGAEEAQRSHENEQVQAFESAQEPQMTEAAQEAQIAEAAQVTLATEAAQLTRATEAALEAQAGFVAQANLVGQAAPVTHASQKAREAQPANSTHAAQATQNSQDVGGRDFFPPPQVGIGNLIHSAVGREEFSSVEESNLTGGMSSAKEQLVEKIIGTLSGVSEIQTGLQREAEVNLQAIASLDECLETKKEQGRESLIDPAELELKLGRNEVKADLDIHPQNYSNVQKDRVSHKARVSSNHKFHHESGGMKSQKEKKKEHKSSEKLWEGGFQLSGCQISPVRAIYKSGDAMDLKKWPKQIEIKGRVRLDALEKFLQEIRHSRTRAVMIISCHVNGDQSHHSASVNALKEAAGQYQRGRRVGYAEPLPGYELYLFPGGGNSLKLLIDHGYLNIDQVLEDEQTLVGFVVCRRSLASSTATHKSSSHYFNANRHVLSGQLDSPTRPNEIQWAGNVIPTSKVHLLPLPSFEDGEAHSAPVSSINLEGTSNNNAEVGMLGMQNMATSNVPETNAHKPVELGSRSFQDAWPGKRRPEWLHTDGVGGGSDDLPPGFGPKPTRHRFEVHDVDDLPEYDFSAQQAFQNKNAKPSSSLPFISPLNMQQAFPTTSKINSLLQMSNFQPETLKSYNHLKPHTSHVPRPVVSHASGYMEQIRALPLASQASQPIVLPHTPSSSFQGFPPGPHVSTDRPIIPVKMPILSQVPNPNLMLTENKEADRPITLEKTQPSLPQSLVDFSRSDASRLKDQRTTGNRGVSQSSSLWDDDDMPEWCPPTRSQSKTQEVSPNQAVQTGVKSAARAGLILAPMGRGWQRTVPSSSLLPSPLLPASLEGGRGILQPPPSPRYMHMLPISMAEQSLAYQNRSNEPRRSSN